MSTHNICFHREKREEKCEADTPSYLELSRTTKKKHLGQAEAGLNSGVVLFSSGPNS